ncbi:MAG: NrsF family protein [Polyangiaceae bacterium]
MSMPPDAPSADLRSRVLEMVAREPAPANTVGARRRVFVVARGIAVASLVWMAVMAHGPEAHGRPLAYVIELDGLWLVLAVTATWAGVSRGRSMLGRPTSWKAMVATLTPVALLLTWIPIALAWPKTLHDGSGLHAHVVCVVMTWVFAAGPLVAFVRLRRASDPVSPRLAGAALGAAAGAWGAVAHALICGYTSPVHIVLGHVLPVALLAAVGVVVGDHLVALGAGNVSRGVRC